MAYGETSNFDYRKISNRNNLISLSVTVARCGDKRDSIWGKKEYSFISIKICNLTGGVIRIETAPPLFISHEKVQYDVAYTKREHIGINGGCTAKKFDMYPNTSKSLEIFLPHPNQKGYKFNKRDMIILPVTINGEQVLLSTLVGKNIVYYSLDRRAWRGRIFVFLILLTVLILHMIYGN